MAEKIIIDLDMLSVPLPPELLADKRAIREALAVSLYRQHRINMQQATELMGITRREFEDRLPEFGISMMDADDLDMELAALDKLPRQ